MIVRLSITAAVKAKLIPFLEEIRFLLYWH